MDTKQLNATMSKSPDNPDRIAYEKRQRQQVETAQRLMELETWLAANRYTHPEWNERINEYNALTIKESQLCGRPLSAGTLSY